MKWKKVIRETGLIEWQCEHGVGHPDMKSIKEMDIKYGKGSEGTWGVHGCCEDNCCSRDDFPGKE
jgi:hypothetical protein